MTIHNPPHPGGIIREFCLEPLGMTVTEASRALGVSRRRLSQVLNERADIGPELALRLSAVFGRSPESWLQLQDQYDLWHVRRQVDLSQLKPVHTV